MEQGVEVLRVINWVEYGKTVLHPIALFLLIIMVYVVLHSDKTFFIIPFIIIAALITHMQRIVLGTFDFSMIRIILIAGVLRILLRNDVNKFEWQKIDTSIIAYIIVLSLAYVLLRRTSSALVNRLGLAFEVLLTYFLLRMYVNSFQQIIVFIRAFSYVFLVIAIFMTIEQRTQYNIFSIFGGVAERTAMREGRVRAQGAFSHPIMAGTFGAAFMPLFWGLYTIGGFKNKAHAILGIISSIVITWASSSSGPVITLLSSFFGIFMWKMRNYMNTIVKMSVVAIILLDIVMDARVWHLISRIDIVGGSTGYHRYLLIDQTIRNFPEWALLGVRTTGHWGWGLNDVTNMFISQAVHGGIGSLLLFLIIIWHGFSSVGEAMKENDSNKMKYKKMFWSWGVVLFAHCVSFFGVGYFGQMIFFWYLTLGLIACLPMLNDGLSSRNEA
ncbi:hypothetical protein [Marispirochaeta aestuarii]|uniref:hypothetical protein n=1 Tax=Marispirochaeta aestuarii TaxID=1963862 RepID=UPI0029C88511|nr:hypothetical protein [Marispirochaeta aestuarii]